MVIGRDGGWWKFSVVRRHLHASEGQGQGECKEIGYKRYLNVGRDG